MTTTMAPDAVVGSFNLANLLIYLFQVMQSNRNVEFDDLRLW
jgi:hypothetical protein